LATFSRSCFSAPGAGSHAITSSPCASARATQPLPITPAPIAANVLISTITAIADVSLFAYEFFDALAVREHATPHA